MSRLIHPTGVMARGIAHEIRTPLTIASSSAQFLTEKDLTPEFRRECAEKVHSGIRKASTIIENLLRFAHPTTNTNRTPVDLPSVVKGALSIVESQAKVQNIEVRTRLPRETGQILGVSGLLEQVFMNLFLNAIHAMPNGGRLTVAVATAPQLVSVQVADTGHGIPAADLGNLFDPFSSKSNGKIGTGLGLPLCYAIVQQHAGAIEVDSTPGQGSAFTVRLGLSPD